MLVLKRLFLILFVIVVPIAFTAALNYGTRVLLVRTHKVIDPQTLHIVTIAEFLAFLFIAILEAKARWSRRS